ncbi:hypothetical protein D9V86_11050 [Bacteroidetes/Chlorobi group bacterium ChocPot_Mid]|nr:MAG: hypothetical protein D9V86_11050 [Bacteroidetes/Chlorobi group bacterium ChocPot_Mid]
MIGCTNPFAPKLVDYDEGKGSVTDQTTIDGLFSNFAYAYKMKDTVVYGNLLTDDFVFTYTNYDRDPVVNESWGRDIDMITTSRLFNAAQRLELIWNEISLSISDSLKMIITRSYALDVMFNPDDRFKLQGKANFTLVKASDNAPWKIQQWRDITNN